MKAIIAIALIVMQTPFAFPASAAGGAANGTPSPFMPPYPDYGLPTHCPCWDAATRPQPAKRAFAGWHHARVSTAATRHAQ
jgi:hypothetical protein